MGFARSRWVAFALVVVAMGACERGSDGRALARGRGVAAAPESGGPAARGGVTDPYRGLGTWIDIYDVPAWDRPEATVRSMASRGVGTIFLQTSNFSRGRPFVYREGVIRFLDAASSYDLNVVAWYLPGFRDVRTDLRRTLAAIRLTTPAGNRFDSFALDIESPAVSRHRTRTRRLLALSGRIRRVIGSEYPLGAIVPSPRGVRTNPSYWPSFPYRRLASLYDVFLPMTYFTWRVSGREGAAWYTSKNVLILRQETAGMRVPIHVIGGIASDATAEETRGFVETILGRDVIGASYYTFTMIRVGQWQALRAIAR